MRLATAPNLPSLIADPPSRTCLGALNRAEIRAEGPSMSLRSVQNHSKTPRAIAIRRVQAQYAGYKPAYPRESLGTRKELG